MNSNDATRERILLEALELFQTQGLKKTTMEEVALQAGLTRATVYRYFPDRKELVRGVFLRILDGFQGVERELQQEGSQEVDTLMDRLGRELAALPRGDLPRSLNELRRVYPDIFNEFRQARLALNSRIFDRLFQVAEKQGILREGLNREVVRAYFLEAVVNVLENERLVSMNLSAGEIFATVKGIFLQGILKEEKRS